MVAFAQPASYDPRQFGAQCDRCFLRTCRQGGPVPPEANDLNLTVAAEAPGEDEVETLRPLIGRTGNVVMQALGVLGISRNDVTLTNAVLCRPPGNKMDVLLRRLKAANEERSAEGKPLYLSPVEACRPRFVTELRAVNGDVIFTGNTSYAALLGRPVSITDIRGSAVEGCISPDDRFLPGVTGISAPGFKNLRIVPTIHGAFALRKRRWMPVFFTDVARAVRWFNGRLKWDVPWKVFQPEPDQLREFLARPYPFFTVDIETEPTEPMTPLLQRLRCVGIAGVDGGMVVPFLSRDGGTLFYDEGTREELESILIQFLENPRICKVGHNFGYFDLINLERVFGCKIANIQDTILWHRGYASELPHSLGFVGSMLTDVMTAWKADHTATEAKTDEELWEYNLTDCVVNARIVEPLVEGVKARGLLKPIDPRVFAWSKGNSYEVREEHVNNPVSVIDVHHRIQAVCAGLHVNGMFVDQEARRAHYVRLRNEANYLRQRLRLSLESFGFEKSFAMDFNPNSRDQVSSVLFDAWNLTPENVYATNPSAKRKLKHAYTKSGDPSTGDDQLRAMLLYIGRETEAARAKFDFVAKLRKFRGACMLQGTNIIPLRPIDEPYYKEGLDELAVNIDDDEDAERIDYEDEYAVRMKEKSDALRKQAKRLVKKLGLTLRDQRVHPHYSAHSVTSQRLASSKPNGQNWSRLIRDIICAFFRDELFDVEVRVKDGIVTRRYPRKFVRALIYADMDQLELRFASALAGAARYLEAFNTPGTDVHALTSELLYGARFKNASEKDRKRMRDFAKRFSYAVLYRATVETVHETIASAENDKGELVFPEIDVRTTRMLRDNWLKAVPEFEKWWDSDLAEFNRQGYLAEPVFGWRRDFADGGDGDLKDIENELANFKCQSGGSAIVHAGTIDFVKEVPFGRWGPGTGLIQQGHDALMAEVPVEHGPQGFDKDGGLIWCPKGCGCITSKLAKTLEECMTRRVPGLDVPFTAKAKIGFRWSDF